MDDERDEWDGPWKEALDNLPLVFELFWPDVLAELDLSKAITPLEQELQKLTPDGNSGLLRVDKLYELAADTGDSRYAHFEAQMLGDLQLPWRMFKYGRRGGDHFNQPIGRFAILGDDDPSWRPTCYTEGVLGWEDTFTFRTVKLSDWAGRLDELEAGDNLFGLFLAAHLETMATRGNVPTRMDAKFRILANLVRRDIHPSDFQRWYRLIDWIMKLPEAPNRAVWLRLQEIKEPKPMSHVTFAEIYGREKGIKEGHEKGIHETLHEALREGLLAKFPEQGATLAAEFEAEQNVERLKFLLRCAFLAQSSDDFRLRASKPA